MMRNGCKPTPDDHEAILSPKLSSAKLAARVRSIVSTPDSVDLRHLVVEVLDQGQTNSCAAHSVAQAIRMMARARGEVGPPLPSRRFLYRDAVGYAHAHRGEPFADEGTTFGDLFSAAYTAGIVDEAQWPWVEASILATPPLSVYREGADRQWALGGYVPIGAKDRVGGLRSALALGHLCVVGVTIDEAFEDMNGPLLVTTLDESVGGHAMATAGYDRDGLWLVNSWSNAYRDRGFVKLAWDIVASPRVMDAWTLDIEPPRRTP